MGPVLLANALPRLSSHPPTTSTATPTHVTPPSLLSAPGLLSATPSLLGNALGTGPVAGSPPHNVIMASQQSGTNAPGPPLGRMLSGEGDGKKSEPLTIDTSQTALSGDGPPTPTHSEVPDCAKGKRFYLYTAPSNMVQPNFQFSVVAPTGSPPAGGLPPMQGVSSSLQALRPQGPTITPSLANHYRDDLVNHVRGWPADILEKQVRAIVLIALLPL